MKPYREGSTHSEHFVKHLLLRHLEGHGKEGLKLEITLCLKYKEITGV